MVRDGIGEPSSDRQHARLEQAQTALLPAFTTSAVTNVEAVTRRSVDGHVVGMTLCAPLGKELLWSIPVDMDRARRLLNRWRKVGVPWLAHNARTYPARTRPCNLCLEGDHSSAGRAHAAVPTEAGDRHVRRRLVIPALLP